jgi:hypothetical protein
MDSIFAKKKEDGVAYPPSRKALRELVEVTDDQSRASHPTRKVLESVFFLMD